MKSLTSMALKFKEPCVGKPEGLLRTRLQQFTVKTMSLFVSFLLWQDRQFIRKAQKILEILDGFIASENQELTRTSEGDLKLFASGWRTSKGLPRKFVEEIKTIRFWPVPKCIYTVDFTLYRLPLEDMD